MGRHFVLGRAPATGSGTCCSALSAERTQPSTHLPLGQSYCLTILAGSPETTEWRNATRHHRIRSHHGMSSDDLIANNRGAETNPALFFDPYSPAFRLWSADCGICSLPHQSPICRLSLVALLGNASRLGSQHVETGGRANVRRGHIKEQEPFPAFLCRTTYRVFLKREDE